ERHAGGCLFPDAVCARLQGGLADLPGSAPGGKREASWHAQFASDKEVVPEFIQQQAKPGAIAKAAQPLMEDARTRERMISEFDSIISKLGGDRASEKTAQAILEEIGKST